ncbi:hypothetical protein [Marinobacter sp. HL-58]|uniref:hypothetical protein n=1 Tax=Marinobacter sp. HL-58 TaxID=1479237 RepID=UPI000488CB23|nr:hypothetical protein [Marinobacter sp. HL-58]KPQ02958.1 MAG: hypothetical protein HLUCCO03_00240 [Marinobacter sp. HL-58]
MMSIKKLSLASAVAASVVLTGCGNSSSSGSDDGTEVGGTVSSPGGQVASFREPSLFEIASSFLVSPVAAAISGLQPVEGADVELIRVDDDGNQIGEILATGRTAVDGSYTLTLPEGVNLAGNLVARITGSADTQMRSQVVEQAVDIDPASEFILQKFVDSDTSLESLEVNDVVRIRDRVEEFDLTASADFQLAEMLAELDSVVGEDLEAQIALATTETGDASTIAGNYRTSGMVFGLHDSDNNSSGTWEAGVFGGDFEFTAGDGGNVTFNRSREEGTDVLLTGPDLANTFLEARSEVDNEQDQFPGIFSSDDILSVESDFSEELGDTEGFRSPAFTYRLQKALNHRLFVLSPSETVIRYGLTAEGDLDPENKLGDELFQSLEIFAATPEGSSDIDLDGDFGRVYLASQQTQGGDILLEAEQNVVSFSTDGTLAASAGARQELRLDPGGLATYSETTGTAETGLDYTISGDGDIVEIGGPADGFINDSLDFISVIAAEEVDNDPVTSRLDRTLMVRLPDGQLSIADKRYRLLSGYTRLDLGGDTTEAIRLGSLRFNSFLNMTSETEANFEGGVVRVQRNSFTEQVSRNSYADPYDDVTVSVDATGAATVSFNYEGGASRLDGFFNEDASIGIFTNRYVSNSDNESDRIGMAILVEVDQ